MQKPGVKPYIYHHPLGRLVGQPGRRQREGYQQLKIDAMQKPFGVVVMRDIPAPRQADKAAKGSVARVGEAITPEQIETAISDETRGLTQGEVNRSIDALRPPMTVLDGLQYRELATKLSQGYTVRQLAAYLREKGTFGSNGSDSRFRGESIDKRQYPLAQSTSWRPGETPLTKRHIPHEVVKKKRLGKNKARLVEQIMVVAWGSAKVPDEQRVGEIEMRLLRWQLSYLFDLTSRESPMWRRLIESPLLADAVKLAPYRPANILRITGRQRDAEEAASILERKLSLIETMSVDLKVFKSFSHTPGWPSSLDQLFHHSDLIEVGKNSQTVIELTGNDEVSIHGADEGARHLGRRMLLSLLPLPCPGNIFILDCGRAYVLYPDGARPDSVVRHQQQNLTRRSMPSFSIGPAASDSETARHRRPTLAEDDGFPASELCSLLDSSHPHDIRLLGETPLASSAERSSYWQPIEHAETSSWEAQICKLLYTSNFASRRCHDLTKVDTRLPATLTEPTGASVISSQVPSMVSLLRKFRPFTMAVPDAASEDRPMAGAPELTYGSRHIVAHLMPSPFVAAGADLMSRLPRLELYFSLPHVDEGKLEFSHMTAILDVQEVRVPLLRGSADLRFLKRTSLRATPLFRTDPELQRFARRLEESFRCEDSVLSGEPEVGILLPAQLCDDFGQDCTTEYVAVPYLLERIERVQVSDFEACRNRHATESESDAKSRLVDHAILRIKEVDPSPEAGLRTEITIRTFPTPPSEGNDMISSAKVAGSDILVDEAGATLNSRQGPALELTGPVDREAKKTVDKLVRASLKLVDLLTEASYKSLTVKEDLQHWRNGPRCESSQ